MRVVIIDTETTGLERGIDHVIDVCIRNFHDPDDVKLWRVRPPIPIPAAIAEIHKITDEMVFHAPSFGEVADEIGEEISRADVIVGYNPDFDVQMLQREFQLAVVDVKWPKIVICSKRLWDIHDPKKRSLSDAYREFVSPEGFDGAHGALADTLATGRVLAAQLAKFSLPADDWSALDPDRARWYGPSNHVVWDGERLMVNFGKYAGKEFAELDSGYLGYLISKDFPDHVKKLSTYAQSIMRNKAQSQEIRSQMLTTWARS